MKSIPRTEVAVSINMTFDRTAHLVNGYLSCSDTHGPNYIPGSGQPVLHVLTFMLHTLTRSGLAASSNACYISAFYIGVD